MLRRTEISQIADVCAELGEAAADQSGFVSIRGLLSRFQADLIVRPLLVEGMLASIEQYTNGGALASKWAVLLDSETFNMKDTNLEAESQVKPLSSRLRNTVAHELAHSLAFRPSEFGIEIRDLATKKAGGSKFVAAIERETERLSPLLLWPRSSIERFLLKHSAAVTIEELNDVRKKAGISREVLINRLNLLSPTDSLRYYKALKNVAIGLAEWSDKDKATLRSWPLFLNFDRNIVPSFLYNCRRQDRIPANAVFNDPQFSLCGGSKNITDFITSAGTIALPDVQKCSVTCSIENGARRVGRHCIFLVHTHAQNLNDPEQRTRSREMAPKK